MVTQSQYQDALEERYELEDKLSDLTEALQKIVSWADAYPVFPDPDLRSVLAHPWRSI